MKKFLSISFIWITSLILTTIWTYENPENIELLKNYFKKNKKIEFNIELIDEEKIVANSFSLNLSKVLSLSEKTAFIIHPKQKLKFQPEELIIYSQNGFILKKLNSQKIELPKTFTLQRNGGIKTVFFSKSKSFALVSASNKDCFYAAIVNLDEGREIFKSKCLPDLPKNIDFNGLGSSNIHHNKKIYLAVGTPEKHASKNSLLAQDLKSVFGKILIIDKNKLEDNLIEPIVYTYGHRVPQGLTKIGKNLFNAEHGPKGGDEINLLKKDENYGWPVVSYGTNYLKDGGGDGKSYKINHSLNNFKEPLFAFVPSIGISSLNNCPKILKEYYKTPCLLALSLRGNDLRKGKSIVIFLLSDDLNKINSIEKIYLGELRLRHFVTDKKNELYEDENGSIYVSADKKGIYKISFSDFR
tara:strand:+ start:1400 stop:2638 length:1239 start_codon:yes stop_codon:yes gene_type:complete